MASRIAIAKQPVLFTTDPDDYEIFAKWLQEHKLTYATFYASFLNYAHTIMQRSKATNIKPQKKDDALVEVLEACPADTNGFRDAMEAYRHDHFRGGVSKGIIDLKDGREASSSEIEKAHTRVAGTLWDAEQSASIKEQYAHLMWVDPVKQKTERKKRKDMRRAERKIIDGVKGMELANDAEMSEA